MSDSAPLKETAPVPSPVMVTLVCVPMVMAPLATESCTVIGTLAPSASPTDRPVTAMAVSSSITGADCRSGTVTTGASLTELTVTATVWVVVRPVLSVTSTSKLSAPK